MMLHAVGRWVQSAYLLSVVPLGVAWAMATLLARRPASVRHHVWVVALTVAIVAPVARGIVPRLNLPLLPPPEVASVRPSPRMTAVEAARPEAIGAAPASSPSRWSAAAIGTLVWLVGAVSLLCVRAVRRARLARLVADGTGVGTQADVRSHVRVKVPMLAGFWQPTILLPLSADDWPADAREAVLAHERAHVQRLDHVTALVSDVATTIYWLNPLAWMAAVALEREREVACDEEVLRAGIKPSVYAAALLTVAQTAPSRRSVAVPSIGSGQLDSRIRAVLHHAPNSGRVPLSWPATMALIAVCAVAVASVRLVARTPQHTMVAERPFATREIASRLAAEPPVASLSRQQPAPTAGRTGSVAGSQLDRAEPGSKLDVGDFCCPDYLDMMIQRVRSSWQQQAETPGLSLCVSSRDACRGVVRFTIERNGTISTSTIEKPTGSPALTARALTAIKQLRTLPPLPAAFPRSTLTVHLQFAASSALATPLKAEIASKAVELSDFSRDMATGRGEQTIVTQSVSGTVTYDTFMQLDANQRLDTFQGLTPANQSGLLREHLARWRRIHADRLTPEQDQILTAAGAFNGPEMFDRRRKSAETIEAFLSLEARTAGVFTPEDAFDAFTLRGSYLPPQ